MSGVRPRAAGKFRTRTPMSGYLVSGRARLGGREVGTVPENGRKRSVWIRMGIVRAGVSEKTVVWMRDRTRIALADRGMSAVSHPERIPLRRFLSVRWNSGGSPAIGRPCVSRRTFPSGLIRSYLFSGRTPSYLSLLLVRRSFCIRFSRSIAIPETNPCRGFSFCPFFFVYSPEGQSSLLLT